MHVRAFTKITFFCHAIFLLPMLVSNPSYAGNVVFTSINTLMIIWWWDSNNWWDFSFILLGWEAQKGEADNNDQRTTWYFCKPLYLPRVACMSFYPNMAYGTLHTQTCAHHTFTTNCWCHHHYCQQEVSISQKEENGKETVGLFLLFWLGLSLVEN